MASERITAELAAELAEWDALSDEAWADFCSPGSDVQNEEGSSRGD